MSNFLDDLKLVMLCAGILLFVGVAMVGGACTVQYAKCVGFGRATGANVRYDWGCYVEVNGEWVSKDYAYELRKKEK